MYIYNQRKVQLKKEKPKMLENFEKSISLKNCTVFYF